MRSPDSSHALFGAMKMLPDLIILDINMPSGNGLAVCEMMACDQRCAHIPVIVHSEIADEAVKRRCERLGAHYVEKSARSWAEIKSLVESLIGEHRAAPPEPKDAVQPSEGAYASHSSMRDSPVLADAKSAGVSASPADRQSPADAAPTSAPTTGRRLVLCIESPKGRLESVEHQLLAVDIEVSRSADPEEGFWTCFTERPFAIVVQIADDKNGLLKLLARIVQHPVTRAIPVLVINENELISAGDLPSAGKIKILEHAVDWEDLLCELEAYCPVLHQDKLIPSPSTRHSAAPAEHKEDKASVAGSQPATGESSQEPIVLLCIDDDPVVAKSIAKRLQPYPINLKWANNGTQGYMMAMAEKPDLIILDLKMPNGEGNYVLVKLKENPHTQNIPVIVLTIEKHLGVRRQMFSIGADAYLNKPIDWAVLFGEMSRCVHLPTQLLQDYRLKDQLSLAEL
jgi:CheY-like chemotaxis protein